MSIDETSSVDGACLCGGVQFRLGLPVKWVAHCHCSLCRRAHGAPFVTWVGVERAGFDLVAGAELLVGYASSAEATREHCGHCGSPLFFRGQRWPDEVHVARALLGELDQAPSAHVFVSDKVSWTHIHDGLPQRGGVSGLEPIEAS